MFLIAFFSTGLCVLVLWYVSIVYRMLCLLQCLLFMKVVNVYLKMVLVEIC
jgi:hypothetical protein